MVTIKYGLPTGVDRDSFIASAKKLAESIDITARVQRAVNENDGAPVEVRLLQTLSKFTHSDDNTAAPWISTQLGLAEELDVHPSVASRSLNDLWSRGLIDFESTEVIGSKRKRRSYSLTHIGRKYVSGFKEMS